jgi:stage II sporulation protein D
VRIILIILISLTVNLSFAQSIRIGLYDNYATKAFSFVPKSGSYTVFGDSTENIHIGIGTDVSCKLKKDSISLTVNGKYYGLFGRVLLQQDSLDSYVELKSLAPSIKAHTFRDNFEMTVVKGKLVLVNSVSMINYLAGVIESEGGGGRHLEYYKVQALISRTYAFKNLKRHKSQGFNLCDAVHCQAYHNMRKYSKTIDRAVEETKGEVFVDSNYNLIGTYFHANCGGQTSDASYVWKNSITYCAPFIDTFCIHTKQANWKKVIPRSEWEGYLNKQYGLDLDDAYIKEKMYSFKQESRLGFYVHPSLGIPLRDLRQKFRLKSTFFDVSLQGSSVVLNGRGFGHGIGLCQEGAMSMATIGYKYKQIGLFYFSGIRIMDYNNLLFFKEEVDEMP